MSEITDTHPLRGAVSEITRTEVIQIDRGTSLREVADLLINSGIGFVVVDDGGSVAGVVSERDIINAVSEGQDLDEVRADEVMSTELVAIESDQTISDAAELMLDSNVRHLLVSGTGGVVSIRDLLAAALASG